MMNAHNIKEQFRGLEQHVDGKESFKVISLPGFQHKLGKSIEGYPKFFICLDDSPSHVNNILREFLTVEYNQVCRVESEEEQIEHAYAIITLCSSEWSLQAPFIDIVLLMLSKIPAMPTRKELAVEVENLITIFSALENPPVKKMQGLWGELLVIDRSNDPDALVNAWHSAPNSKYDFTLGRDKIEVKTTSSENRVHRFSLGQLNPSPSSRLLIASITVRESGQGNGGKSIQDLLDGIYTRVLGNDERLHLYQVVAQTLGRDITKINSVYFDYIEAIDSLNYFRAQDIPHIDSNDVPAGVTEVKFASNLADVPTAFSTDNATEYRNSPLFKCVM